ncbi:aldo/keto reductase [Prochlorococcus sp. MIT 1223]|uniref:aldo/keto reductase n=1 Tax=Prochlorococcus sp. MIT 1223 TaxID=3096217 RepID=UPI002A75542F|nr:aldo/keto reductase [Prochlorococcus sp. MIT 1223]
MVQEIIESKYLERFSLGTASFGNKYGICNDQDYVDQEKATQIVKYFIINGGYQFDTSCGYGDSEDILSRAIGGMYDGNMEITSKFVVTDSHNLDLIIYQIDQSFNLFGDSLNTILCHTPDLLKRNLEDITIEAFKYIKESYRIRTGISIYNIEEIINISNNLKSRIDCIQAPCNIFDDTAQRVKKSSFIGNHTNVIARSIYLQGFLISEVCLLRKYITQYARFVKISEDLNMGKVETCLRYIMSIKELDGYIVGINKLSHLKELVNLIKYIELNNKQFVLSMVKDNNDPSFIDPRRW